MAIGRVKKILHEVEALNGREQASFVRELPNVIFRPRCRSAFSENQIAAFAALAKKHKGRLFDSPAKAREFLRHL